MQTRRVGSLLVSLLLIGAIALAWFQRLAIYDWARLRNYQPPAFAVTLADHTTMDPSMRRLFYVYHPELDDKAAFNTNCKVNEQTIVLGCYVENKGIYIYNVNDPRLNGVLEVTAAHEALHAAYDRLNSKDKQRIDNLLNQTYAGLKDERIQKTIESYKKNGADVTNELHSILGTEVRNLPAELETYYRRYFDNRLQIVAYSEKYESVFTQQKQRLNTIESELKQLKLQIDGLEAELTNERSALQRERPKVHTQSEADAFNARVENYNANVQELRKLINKYNNLIEEYNTLAIEQQSLYQSLDSRLQTVPSQ
jgi:hypothetical protein